MSKNTKLIIALVSLIVMFAAATVIYNKTAEKYSEQDLNLTISQYQGGVISQNATSDFTVYNDSLEKVSLYDNRGKPVIVNFWATWCPPCRAELGYFEDAYKKYGENITFMMVDMTDSRETVDTVRSFVKSNGYTFPVYYDSDNSAGMAYGIRTIPMTLVISSDMELLASHTGVLTQSELEQLIALVKD